MLEGKETFPSYPSPCKVKLPSDDEESSVPQETRVRLNSNNKANNFITPPCKKNYAIWELFTKNAWKETQKKNDQKLEKIA